MPATILLFRAVFAPLLQLYIYGEDPPLTVAVAEPLFELQNACVTEVETANEEAG